ncbi:MAG TPA: GxxExxY protein [Bacteroidales bacterium]|nr:GxxExxY protein [Bacteroidales bacterium]
MDLLHEDLTEKIIKAFYKVHHTLGYGFLESVYENALWIELTKMGIECVRQKPIQVYYESEVVGSFYADILVENKIILELKAVSLVDEHTFQLLNYLKATTIELVFLLSFGKTPKYARKVFSNERKNLI